MSSSEATASRSPGLGTSGGKVASDDRDTVLSDRQVQWREDELAPAIREGNSVVAATLLSSQLSRIGPERLQDLNRQLSARALPSAADLLARGIRDPIISGAVEATPIRYPFQLQLTLTGLRNDVEETLGRARDHRAMQESILVPAKFEEYEHLFWDLHVLNNQLNNAHTLARFAAVVSNLSQTSFQQETPSQSVEEALAINFERLAARALAAQQALFVRATELRIYRMEDAIVALDDAVDAKARLLAAYVVDTDGFQLDQFFRTIRESDQSHLSNSEIASQEVEENLKQLIESARTEHNESLRKGRALFAAMHWWLRGRYGSGTEFHGLLKSPAAINDAAARFSLYMPVRRQSPTDPFDEQNVSGRGNSPQFDRRHHYNWAYLDRRIVITSEQSYSTETERGDLLDYEKSTEAVFW